MSLKETIGMGAVTVRAYFDEAYNAVRSGNVKELIVKYKGRFVEQFNNDPRVSTIICVASNVLAYRFLEKASNYIDNKLFGKKYCCLTRLAKNGAFSVGVGYGIYQTNLIFCKYTGFEMTSRVMKSLALGAALLRFFQPSPPFISRTFNSATTSSRKIVPSTSLAYY